VNKEEQIMNMPHYAEQFSEAHRQHILEEISRERLADLARSSSARPSRLVITQIVNAIQRTLEQCRTTEQQTSTVSETVQPITNA
jgi:hypothetical protein